MFKRIRSFVHRLRHCWRLTTRGKVLFNCYYAEETPVLDVPIGAAYGLVLPAGSRIEVFLTPPPPDPPPPPPSRHW